MTLEDFISGYDEADFKKAVHILQSENIIFEGDFQFLNAHLMRDGKSQIIFDALKHFGCGQELLCLGFEVVDEGWMYSLFYFGDKFDSTSEIERGVQNHYRIKK